MIITFAGTPGSGKSYDTVKKILDNLRLGRKVYTNVDGLDDPVCREHIKIYTGLDDYQLGTQLFFLSPDLAVKFWQSEVVNKGTEFETEQLICEKGSMVVLDEVHKLFNCRDWQTEKNRGFADWASTHRHDGYDVLLVTQDLEKVDKQVRSLVEWTYVYRKINFLGSLVSNGYLVYSYAGDDAHGKPMATQRRSYDSKVFRCYRSYTSKDMKELGLMKHTNILKHPVFYSIPVVIFLAIYLITCKSSFATGDIFGAKKALNRPVGPLSAGTQALKGNPPVAPFMAPALPTPVPVAAPSAAPYSPPPLPASVPPGNVYRPALAQDSPTLAANAQSPATGKQPAPKEDLKLKPKHEIVSYIQVNNRLWVRYADSNKLLNKDGCVIDEDLKLTCKD